MENACSRPHDSRELPLLAKGPSVDLPRVYDIALEAIAHGDGRVDPESLNRSTKALTESGMELDYSNSIFV